VTEHNAAARAGEALDRATSLHRDGRLDEAVAAYRETLDLDPRCRPAWYAQGCAWETKGDDATALTCFQAALAISPDHAESHHNLGNVLHKLGLTDQAMEHFRAAIAAGQGFLPRTAIATLIPGSPAATNRTVLDERRSWATGHLPPPDRTRFRAVAPSSERRLRIGYLSSFFQSNNWMKPVWGLIHHHDRAKVELHLFSDAPVERCRDCYDPHASDRFHDISALGNHAAAAEIERFDLDLLVDLNGYSSVERLAVVALRPAPLVLGWFGLYATSGMACYDYLIGDDHVLPGSEEKDYSETILRVPGSYLAFDVRYRVPEVASPPAQATHTITFGSLASQYKITPPVVNAWSRILQRVPGARLLVKNSSLGSAANREFLWQRFERAGVDRRRVVLEGGAPHFDYLAAYDRIDIALDTFPYNGGTTTSEALWQGVPVLAFWGDRWASRTSASILRAAALDEWVTEHVDDFVDRAVSWGTAPEGRHRLAELRDGMRAHLGRAPLCDMASFARSMEALYARAVNECAAGAGA
jgi:protein O-GlcNAc transferase